LRGLVRDIMAYHAGQFDGPAEKVGKARELLGFLARSVAAENTPYAALLKVEIEAMGRRGDSYLFHDYLEAVNEPLYFPQFADRAAGHGLRYLAQPRVSIMT